MLMVPNSNPFTRRVSLRGRTSRTVTAVVVTAILLPSFSIMAEAAPPPQKVTVNRTVPDVSQHPDYPVFSSSPTAPEITRARVFQEPLLAIGDTTDVENSALASA